MYIYIHTYLKRFIYIYIYMGYRDTQLQKADRPELSSSYWNEHPTVSREDGPNPQSIWSMAHAQFSSWGRWFDTMSILQWPICRGVSRPKWVIFPRLIADLIVDFPFSWLHSLVMSVMPNDCRFILYRHIYTLWEVHIFLLQHHASFYFCCFNRFLT